MIATLSNLTLQDIQPWQTLIGGGIALLAALLAYWNTTRAVRNARKLELWRRSRKHAALRALLPLALSEISDYAERTIRPLNVLYDHCVDGSLVHAGVAAPDFERVPSDVIRSLSDFIEYSDDADVQLFVRLIRRIQVYQARLRSLTSKLEDHDETSNESWIETMMLQGATIYAGAAAAFDYGRGKTDNLPKDADWAGVRSALKNLGLWDFEVPKLHELISKYEEAGAGPE
jgi:hypothetical protein